MSINVKIANTKTAILNRLLVLHFQECQTLKRNYKNGMGCHGLEYLAKLKKIDEKSLIEQLEFKKTLHDLSTRL